ncbi:MAG: RNA 3'-terminal phosphate cyclase [Deltaproteobacteria bacterium]|nr:RNA 3'-terminal phosphate cyclase [Deltaproteobacteria bacterium]
MIEIDGSVHSGSGTLLRYAVSLATLIGKPIHMKRIRAKRQKPGLRPQHLQALRACATFSGGGLEGDRVGSQEIHYAPGSNLRGGDFKLDIGTAGSTTMLAFTLLPLALHAENTCRFSLTGGLFQDFAPSAFHMQKVLIPLLRRMGAEIRMEIKRPGYVPKGGGEIFLQVKPRREPLEPLRMPEQGSLKRISGVSLSSHLEREKVSERMAGRCRELLEELGLEAEFEILRDSEAHQKGAALMLLAETDRGCLIGADRAGKPGRRSEIIAEFVVRSLFEDLSTGATVDRHLADQIILFAALADGGSTYRIPFLTDHIRSNLWLVEKILDARTSLEDRILHVEGVAFSGRRDHA